MSVLDQLRPKSMSRMIDLVREAGVDVGDWENFRGGREKAGANPKYCYNWAFTEMNQVVVLSIWYDDLGSAPNGTIFYERDRRLADGPCPNTPVWLRRARQMDAAIGYAFDSRVPVRVIICDGTRRRENFAGTPPSRVARRLLDPAAWLVSTYSTQTGAYRLERQAPFLDDQTLRIETARFRQQFDQYPPAAPPEGVLQPVSRFTRATQYQRDPRVRAWVLKEANGKCEACGTDAPFQGPDGEPFFELHHLVTLAEGGPDIVSNTVAVCPNCHRRLHYGADRLSYRDVVVKRIDLLRKA